MIILGDLSVLGSVVIWGDLSVLVILGSWFNGYFDVLGTVVILGSGL